MFKGIVFDFNGTLFIDTDLHTVAWRKVLQDHPGRSLTEQEFNECVAGKENAFIVRYFWGEMADERAYNLAYIKEAEYRKICLSRPERLHLTEGAELFLDLIKARGFPHAVATSSEAENVRFYFDHLGLSRWFAQEHVLYLDGTIPRKPDPAIYLKAAGRIGLSPSECLVFEDSPTGILSARNAGAGRIVAVCPSGSGMGCAHQEGVSYMIRDFTGAERFIDDPDQ